MLPLILLSTAHALTWNEATSGDLSGDHTLPTPIGELAVGDNLLIGTLFRDEDNAVMSMPFGTEVTEAWIDTTNYQALGGIGVVRFFQITPFQPLGGASITTNYSNALPVTMMTPAAPFGFQVYQTGAAFDWTLRVTLASTCGGGEILWDEAVDGDIPGDQAAPTDLGVLSAGQYVVCGGRRADVDAVVVELGDYAHVSGVEVFAEHVTLDGVIQGRVELFQPGPYVALDTQDFRADGHFVLSPTGATSPVGFVATTNAAGGTTYGYRTIITVEERRPAISVQGQPVAGRPAVFDLSGLSPGRPFYLAASLNRGVTPIPSCPGRAAEIASPRVIATGNASRSGTFSATVPLPALLAGRSVYLQLFDPAACALSRVVTLMP